MEKNSEAQRSKDIYWNLQKTPNLSGNVKLDLILVIYSMSCHLCISTDVLPGNKNSHKYVVVSLIEGN